jgi:ATP-dependent DNA helicase RecG
MTVFEIKNILTQGENLQVEFKSAFNAETIETLVAFANAKGGSVYIGISDLSKIIGVLIGTETINQWINEVKTKTLPMLIPDAEVIVSEGKNIVVLSIQEYPIKPVSFRGKYFNYCRGSEYAFANIQY